MISAIIPAFNASSRIAMTLESVIAQNYDDIEIIVVDDASCDGTGKIAREILSSSGRNYTLIAHAKNMGVSSQQETPGLMPRTENISVSLMLMICCVKILCRAFTL